MALSSSDGFEVHHPGESHVLVPFVNVGWNCSVPEALILPARYRDSFVQKPGGKNVDKVML